MVDKSYIFLDIDGVLNSDEHYTRMHNNKLDYNPIEWDIDRSAVDVLNKIIDKSGVDPKIVISSSWGYNSKTIECLAFSGLDKSRIIGGTDGPFIGYDRSHDWVCRGNMILKWLIENGIYETKFCSNYCKYYKFSYLILDDDSDMLLSQQKHFIKTDFKYGLNESHIDKAVNILNNIFE